MSGSAGTLKLTSLAPPFMAYAVARISRAASALASWRGWLTSAMKCALKSPFHWGADVHHASPPMNAGCIHVPLMCSESMNLAASHSGHETFV